LIETKIYEIISDILKVDVKQIKRDLCIGDVEEWDSLAHLQIFMELEKEFDIKFSMDDISNLDCINKIIDKVKQCKK